VAIGAPSNNGNGHNSGHVRVFYNCYSKATINLAACDSCISPSGKYTWYTSGIYYDTIPNSNGCDSLITIDLSVFNVTNYINEFACDYYVSPSGNHTWNTTGIYYDTISGSGAYDCIVTINLTVTTLNNSVTQNGNILTAIESGASYQWLDCDSLFYPISGETNQSYIPTVTGNYAVEISKNGCVDTSACLNVIVSILENEALTDIHIYPNPTTGKITVECENMERVEVVDITGKLIYEIASSLSPRNDVLEIDISAFSKGVYFVKVTSEDGVAVERIVLE
jgi:hypothetical protein